MFGYSSFIYGGILSFKACSSRLMALLTTELTIVSSKIALLSLKLRYLKEAGIYGKTNEPVFITKWNISPLTLARVISGGKSSFAIKNSTISSRLNVIVAIVTLYKFQYPNQINI